jgi:hypothetical protein
LTQRYAACSSEVVGVRISEESVTLIPFRVFLSLANPDGRMTISFQLEFRENEHLSGLYP